MKLQILIPQYNETDEVIKPLLDSVAIQQNIDFNEVGVIICNDGSDIHLSQSLLDSYPFKIEYYLCEHRGVSATRDECFNRSRADYVMWCDADDMFYNACGLWMLFNQMDLEPFDTLMSAFIEETRHPETKQVLYVDHPTDSTFVHGKVHRRQYLIDKDIRWNHRLTIHEDSYFNILCQSLTENGKYCQVPFYLWKWRDESVCRHDPKYILKTYNNMLDSNTELIKQFIARDKLDLARQYSTMMIYDAYYTMNKDEWLNQENQEYRNKTELRFKRYYNDFKDLANSIDPQVKYQVIAGLKNRFFQEGMFMEAITFVDWIKHIEDLDD